MTQLLEIVRKLSDRQQREVEDFAVGLLSRSRAPDGKPNRIRLDELDGLLVRTADDMSDEVIAKRVLNQWADAAED